MSHLSKIELEVRDLGVLKKACKLLGLTLITGQETFKWYGREAQCDHAIKIPGANYEIGVIRNNGLYELNCDFYDANIEKVIGKKGGLLKQAYAVQKTKIEARKNGYSILERNTENGIRLHVRVS